MLAIGFDEANLRTQGKGNEVTWLVESTIEEARKRISLGSDWILIRLSAAVLFRMQAAGVPLYLLLLQTDSKDQGEGSLPAIPSSGSPFTPPTAP